MKIKIIRDLDNFRLLEKEWNILYKNPKKSFFQSFSFNYYSWLHILSNNKSNFLSIVLIIDNGLLVAILPFYISRGVVRFICDVHADFCDILLKPGYSIEFNRVVRSLKMKNLIKSFRLINLREDSCLQIAMEDYKYFFSDSITSYSYIKLLRGEFPNNTNMLSKQRYNINKIIQRDIGKHYLLSKENLDDFPYKDIIYLRNVMIKLGHRKRYFLDNKWILFLQDMYVAGLLQISLIKNNNKAHAISFIMRCNNTRMFWIDLFSNIPRVNIYNYIKFITSVSIDYDKTEMHFGRGLYGYKMRNFKPIVKDLTEINIYFNSIKYYLFLIKRFIYKVIVYKYRSR